jgi:DNA-binding CsgD family transcriptional regulator
MHATTSITGHATLVEELGPATTLGYERPGSPTLLFDPSQLWKSLVSGRVRISASYCSTFGCHLELTRTSVSTVPPKAVDSDTLERILLGEGQKVIAFDTERAVSTIATRAHHCLQSLGIEQTVSNLPTALIILVHSAHGHLREASAQASLSALGASTHRLTFRRPVPFSSVWSPAESCLIDCLVEGLSRGDMARIRRTSLRTIANQVAQVYRKANVSRRIPFLTRLIEINDYPENGSIMLSESPCHGVTRAGA